MINKNLYIWACDLSSYTGEGALADLFIKKKLTKNNNIHIINKIENINIKNNTFYGKYIAPFVGIYYCWKYYLSKKKVCYLNYLPLWNFLIFILLPPNTMLGPITGGSKYKKELSINYLIRSFIFPKLYKVSDIIIRSRDYKIIFSTSLLKKYLKTSVPNVKKQDITNLIDIVLSDLEKNRFINDKFYSESKSRSLIQRGSSVNKIRNYLMTKGINDRYIKETIDKIKEDNSDQDFFSGIKICKKKRIGPARVEDNRVLFYKKDIALLARNGFDFETSKRIMDIDQADYMKIIRLL